MQDKVEKALNKILKALNQEQLTIPELIRLYGNLGYQIGTSIAGVKKQVSLEELKQLYYTNPTVDVGLMLQGLLITSWEEDFQQKPVLSNIGEKK